MGTRSRAFFTELIFILGWLVTFFLIAGAGMYIEENISVIKYIGVIIKFLGAALAGFYMFLLAGHLLGPVFKVLMGIYLMRSGK